MHTMVGYDLSVTAMLEQLLHNYVGVLMADAVGESAELLGEMAVGLLEIWTAGVARAEKKSCNPIKSVPFATGLLLVLLLVLLLADGVVGVLAMIRSLLLSSAAGVLGDGKEEDELMDDRVPLVIPVVKVAVVEGVALVGVVALQAAVDVVLSAISLAALAFLSLSSFRNRFHSVGNGFASSFGSYGR